MGQKRQRPVGIDGQAGHAAFDGRAEQFLDILRSQARRLGVDADLDRRYVGKGVDGDLAKRLDDPFSN